MGAIRRAAVILAGALILIAFSAQGSTAATISLAMSMTINANPDSFTVTVHLENRGDAPAHDVTALLSIMDRRLASNPIQRLMPNKPLNITYFQKMGEIPKGSFPAILLVDYHDESGYAFSALHSAAFDTKPDIKKDMVVETKPAEIAKNAVLGLKMQNPGDRARDFRVRLILPREFSGRDRDRVFLLDSKEQKKLEFEVVNLSALTGASYPACFVVEYDEDYVHFTVVADARMTVVAEASWFKKTKALWWIFLGFCVLGVLVATLRRGRDRAR